jgi:hypothetical protein
VYGPIAIPFTTSVKGTDKKLEALQVMMDIKSRMADDFKHNVIPQLLLREGYDDMHNSLTGGKSKGGGGKTLKVTAYSLFPALIRASAAGAKRFLGQSYVFNDKKNPTPKSGYLKDEKNYHHRLGFVAQTSPLPMPIRIYDKTSAFIFQQTCATFPDLWIQQPVPNSSMKTVRRLPIGQVDNDTFVRILLSIVMVRSTGNIEAIRDYLEISGSNVESEDGSCWCRLFKLEDSVLFPIYMAAKRDVNSTSASKTTTSSMTDRCSIAPFIKTFFVESVPEYIRQGPYFLLNFLVNFLNQLQADIMANDKLGIRNLNEGLSRRIFLEVLGGAISSSIQSTKDN